MPSCTFLLCAHINRYGILIDTLGKVGKTTHAEEMVEFMRSKGIKPDTIIYNYLVQGMARAKHLEDAVRVVEKMIGEKVPATEATCRPLITNLVRGTCPFVC